MSILTKNIIKFIVYFIKLILVTYNNPLIKNILLKKSYLMIFITN